LARPHSCQTPLTSLTATATPPQVVTEANTYDKSQAEYDDDLKLIGRAFRNTDIPFDPSVEFEFEIDNTRRTITYVSDDSTLIMSWDDPSETRRVIVSPPVSPTDTTSTRRRSGIDEALASTTASRRYQLGRSNTDPGYLDRESLLDIALDKIRSERLTEGASLTVQSGRSFLEYDVARDAGRIGVESRLGVTNFDMKRSEVDAIKEAMREAGWRIA
jgi:hypothetical protein